MEKRRGLVSRFVGYWQLALAILVRHLVLIYPWVGFQILEGFLTRNTSESVPAFEPRWLMLMGILLLLAWAFEAGWFAMFHGAVKLSLKPEPPPADQPMTEQLEAPATIGESCGLFKRFIPGVGQYFIPVAIGNFIQLVVIALLLGLMHVALAGQHGAAYWHPLAELGNQLFQQIQAGQPATIGGPEGVALTAAQQQVLGSLGWMLLGGCIIYMAVYLMTMLWVPLVYTRGMNIFRAYGHAIRQFFADGPLLTWVGLTYITGNLTMMLLIQYPNAILQLLGGVMSFFVSTGFTMLLFVYVKNMLPPVSGDEAPSLVPGTTPPTVSTPCT